MRDLPSLERLQEMFVHDPETGSIYKKIGHQTTGGYVYIYVDGKQYPAHRIIWKLETGKDPDGVIDHINGVTSDNRVENLMDVSHAENMRNKRDRTKERNQKDLQTLEKWKARLKDR